MTRGNSIEMLMFSGSNFDSLPGRSFVQTRITLRVKFQLLRKNAWSTKLSPPCKANALFEARNQGDFCEPQFLRKKKLSERFISNLSVASWINFDKKNSDSQKAIFIKKIVQWKTVCAGRAALMQLNITFPPLLTAKHAFWETLDI